MIYKGKVHKVGEHIDTDAIIPARFLVTSDPVKLGENCMAGIEPDWVRRVNKGDMVRVTAWNDTFAAIEFQGGVGYVRLKHLERIE